MLQFCIQIGKNDKVTIVDEPSLPKLPSNTIILNTKFDHDFSMDKF